MDDNRKLAEEVWNKLRPYLDDMHYICKTIAAYGEARYKAGVEAMRDAAFEPFSSHEYVGRMTLEYVGRMTLWHHLQDAARLLEGK